MFSTRHHIFVLHLSYVTVGLLLVIGCMETRLALYGLTCFIRDVGMDNSKWPWPLNSIFLLQYLKETCALYDTEIH